MLDSFIIWIIVAVIILFIVHFFVFIHNKSRSGERTTFEIDIQTLKNSNVAKAMIASYIIFGIIFGIALIFTSYSDWLTMIVVLGTSGLCVYGALMRKKWVLIPWGTMTLFALGGFFLVIDYARLSLLGILGLIIIAYTLFLYNMEKNDWN